MRLESGRSDPQQSREEGSQSSPSLFASSAAPKFVPWDERQLPAQLSVWALAGFLVGLIWVLFDDGSDTRRVPVVIGTLVLLAMAAILSARVAGKLRPRVGRGMIFAFCTSIILNLSLLLATARIPVFVRIAPDLQITPPPPYESPREEVPEYFPLVLEGEDRVALEEREPVPTGEPQMEPRDLIQRSTLAMEDSIPRELDGVFETPPTVDPQLLPRQSPLEVAPRRFDAEGLLSSQPRSFDQALSPASAASEARELDPNTLPAEVPAADEAPVKTPLVTGPQKTSTAETTSADSRVDDASRADVTVAENGAEAPSSLATRELILPSRNAVPSEPIETEPQTSLSISKSNSLNQDSHLAPVSRATPLTRTEVDLLAADQDRAPLDPIDSAEMKQQARAPSIASMPPTSQGEPEEQAEGDPTIADGSMRSLLTPRLPEPTQRASNTGETEATSNHDLASLATLPRRVVEPSESIPSISTTARRNDANLSADQPVEKPDTQESLSLPPNLASRTSDRRLSNTTTDSNDSGRPEVPNLAPQGDGGFSIERSKDLGVITRKAEADSEAVVDSLGRFIRQEIGGRLSINTQVAIPAQAYRNRLNRRGIRIAGGNDQAAQRTERAIEMGLVYLASMQAKDGSWSLARASETASLDGESEAQPVIQSSTAATGLSLLSFLGAGYDHRSDRYNTNVRQGLDYLIRNQQPNGDLYVRQDIVSNRSAWLYSHGVAAIALCEAYGMTQDPDLRQPAQKAIDFIVTAQNPRLGGWRYSPTIGSDTSVSGWMVMAMRSAELANLDVPSEAWEGVVEWLDRAQESPDVGGIYRYNPLAPLTPSQQHGRKPTKSMTAVGLLMRLYAGWGREHPDMLRGADLLIAQLPDADRIAEEPRDTYYWYYATQVMFHLRGDYWDRWNARLHPLLTKSQELSGPLAGSWDPMRPSPDRWGAQAGRLYVTTMNLLSLEVIYRHLPIYEDTLR